jgi:hypothetical protein
VIEKLQAHYGFTRMPFGRDLAPGMLHRHASHNEAVARISWCISERSIGVVTGEVGAEKTVSVRTVLSGLDPSKHTVPSRQLVPRGYPLPSACRVPPALLTRYRLHHKGLSFWDAFGVANPSRIRPLSYL